MLALGAPAEDRGTAAAMDQGTRAATTTTESSRSRASSGPSSRLTHS